MGWGERPDWSSPVSLAGRLLHPAYERPGLFFAPPVSLQAAAADGGSPFQLDVYRQDRGAGGLASFSLLTLRFAAEYELEAARNAAFVEHPKVRIEPLPIESGLLRLTGAAALGLPEAVSTPQPLDVASAASIGLGLRLDGPATDLFLGALRQGLATVGAEAWLVVRGVAARALGEVRLSPAAVAAALGGTGVVAVDTLRAQLTNAPESLGVTASPPPASDLRAAFAEAVLDRLIGRFGTLVPASEGGQGAWVRLDHAAMSEGEVRWDLNDAVLAPRLFALHADPLGPLRSLPLGEIESRLVRRHDVRGLVPGQRTLSIADTLPKRRAGLLGAVVEIEAGPVLPARPATVRATAPLDGANASTAALRLAVGEPLAFEWRTVAFVASPGGVESVAGPVRQHTREHLVVTPDDFGLRFVTVQAEQALLLIAKLTVECTGVRGGRPWAARGVLEAAEPALAFAVPADVQDPQIGATAKALSDGAERRMAPVPAATLRIDPFSFEGSGAREATVTCVFDDSAREALLELAPEDRAEAPPAASLVRLTPTAPTRRWTWLALSPFRSRFRWRWAGTQSWSEPVDPATPLSVRSSGRPGASALGKSAMTEEIEIDGVRLTPVDGQRSAWSYQPTRAGIATDASGRAQFTLIEAGAIAMLALTAMWGVSTATLESVRQSLASRAGVQLDQVMLSPKAVDVGEVTLLLGDGAGAFTALAATRSSGAPPYHAAFNATLDSEQASKVKKAARGERGWLAVRYAVSEQASVTMSGAATASASASAAASVSRGGGGDATSASFAAEASLAAKFVETAGARPKVQVFQSDAADWGLAG